MVEVINGSPIELGDIKHLVKLPYTVQDHSGELSAFISQLKHYALMLDIFWLRHHKITINYGTGKLLFGQRKTKVLSKPQKVLSDWPQVYFTGVTAFCRRINKKKQYSDTVYKGLMVYELNKVIEDSDKKLSLEQMIYMEYHEFLPLFSEAEAQALPLHYTSKYKITLKEQSTYPFGLLYSLSQTKLKPLHD